MAKVPPVDVEVYVKLLPSHWTSKNGRTNSSDRFEELVEAVGELLDGGVFSLAQGPAGRRQVARLIMAQLAHVHGLAPTHNEVKNPS